MDNKTNSKIKFKNLVDLVSEYIGSPEESFESFCDLDKCLNYLYDKLNIDQKIYDWLFGDSSSYEIYESPELESDLYHILRWYQTNKENRDLF